MKLRQILQLIWRDVTVKELVSMTNQKRETPSKVLFWATVLLTALGVALLAVGCGRPPLTNFEQYFRNEKAPPPRGRAGPPTIGPAGSTTLRGSR